MGVGLCVCVCVCMHAHTFSIYAIEVFSQGAIMLICSFTMNSRKIMAPKVMYISATVDRHVHDVTNLVRMTAPMALFT